MFLIAENGVPNAIVVGAHIETGVFNQVGDATDFGETTSCLLNSNGLTWDLHNVFIPFLAHLRKSGCLCKAHRDCYDLMPPGMNYQMAHPSVIETAAPNLHD